MVKARIFLWWPIPGQRFTNKLFTKLNPACIFEYYLLQWSRQPSWKWAWYSQILKKSKGFPSTSGIQKYCIIRKQGETCWIVKARISLCWPIPDQHCTNKLFTKLNHSQVCVNYPSPIEQATLTQKKDRYSQILMKSKRFAINL